jgi:hypothetical protein
MKIKFIILSLFFFKISFAQYYAKWVSKPHEYGVISYSLQDSIKASKWIEVASVKPFQLADTNFYSVAIKTQNSYYRIVTSYVDGSKRVSPVLYLTANVVAVTNAVYTRQSWLDILSWSVSGQNNIYFFRIDQTTDGRKYNLVVNYRNDGNKDYKYSIYRKYGTRPTYRITPIFNDLSLGTSIIFK